MDASNDSPKKRRMRSGKALEDAPVNNSKHRISLAMQASASVALGIIALVMILLISVSNVFKWDVTAHKRYTLSEFSLKAVRSLKEPVDFYFFVSDADGDRKTNINNVMEGYVSVRDSKVSYEFIDLRKNPVKAKEMGAKGNGDVIVKCGKRSERLYDVSEEGVTGALVSISNRNKNTVYFLQGHGERGFEKSLESISKLKKALLAEGYKVETFTIGTGIPEEIENLAIIAPVTAFTAKERHILEKWLDKGGNLLLCLDLDSADNYDWLLSKLGVKSPQELVFDIKMAYAGAEPVFVATNVYDGSCTATKGMRLPSCYKTARPIDHDSKVKAGSMTITPIVSTDINAVSVSLDNLESLSDGRKVKYVRQGVSIPLIQTVEREIAKAKDERGVATKDKNGNEHKDTKKSRSIVSGDADFLSNELFDASQFANKDLVLNLFGWMGGSETNMEIRAKEASSEPLMLSARAFIVFGIIVILIIPGIVFFYGMSVVMKRKRN